jgi:hypothetical protein
MNICIPVGSRKLCVVPHSNAPFLSAVIEEG